MASEGVDNTSLTLNIAWRRSGWFRRRPGGSGLAFLWSSTGWRRFFRWGTRSLFHSFRQRRDSTNLIPSGLRNLLKINSILSLLNEARVKMGNFIMWWYWYRYPTDTLKVPNRWWIQNNLQFFTTSRIGNEKRPGLVALPDWKVNKFYICLQ